MAGAKRTGGVDLWPRQHAAAIHHAPNRAARAAAEAAVPEHLRAWVRDYLAELPARRAVLGRSRQT